MNVKKHAEHKEAWKEECILYDFIYDILEQTE